MFKYYNANPFGRNVNDCTVRAISLATEQTWEQTFDMLSHYAKKEKITFSEIDFINNFLEQSYGKAQIPQNIYTLKDFMELQCPGRWLVTMPNHITCVIDGVCYDTFDPSKHYIWGLYRVK